MQMVAPDVADPGVELLDTGLRLDPVFGKLLFAAHGPLIPGQSLCMALHRIHWGDDLTGGQGGKICYAQIHADDARRWMDRFRHLALGLDGYEPFATNGRYGDCPYYFTVSLRFTHPVMKWEEFAGALGSSPEFSWNVGEPRKTPKGAPLEGVRKETYVCFALAEKNSGDLGDFLMDALEKLEPMKGFFERVLATGGKPEFFIGVFAKADMGFDLEPLLLAKMGDLGVRLSLCFYLADEAVTTPSKTSPAQSRPA